MNILMAAAGALSIYLGYRLFCDSADHGSHGSRRSGFRHLISGGLLAVFGLGILIADVRSLREATPDSRAALHDLQKRKSTKEGSFDTPKVHRRTGGSERLV